MVQTYNGRVEGVEEVKELVKCFFEEWFQEKVQVGPILEGIKFIKFSLEDNAGMHVEFSKEDFKGIIWECERDISLWHMGLVLIFWKSVGV